MSDFPAWLRKPEFPDWLRALYCLIFLAAFAHAALTEGALRRLPAGVWRIGGVRPPRADRRRADGREPQL